MIRLGLRENQTAFRPGEAIAGAVLWEFDTPPKSAGVRLVWFTRGKGTEDGGIAASVTFDAPPAADTREFRFDAANGPYSFSGTLIAVMWAVEFVMKPGGSFQRIDIVIAPDAREIHLPKIEQPKHGGLQVRRR